MTTLTILGSGNMARGIAARALADGRVAGQELDVILAGDSDDAKARVAAVVQDGGLRPIDAGPLKRAQPLEHLGFLHMALQMSRGTNFATTVKLVDPQ